MKKARYGEGPLLLRLLLVLSSMSPLFLLWAIRGTSLMPQGLFLGLCTILFIVPNAVLFAVIMHARGTDSTRIIHVAEADDRRQDVIATLFAMLLPFYSVDMDTWRNLMATVVAFSFVVILFWSLNLHYLNVVGAVFGYHFLHVTSPQGDDSPSSALSFMVITKKPNLQPGSQINGYEITNTVLLEAREWT